MRGRLLSTLLLVLALALALACRQKTAPGRIILFDGWAIGTSAVITGRVIEDKQIADPEKTQGSAENVLASFDAIETDEIAGAVLEVEIAGKKLSATTDRDGRFEVTAADFPAPFTEGAIAVRAKVVEDRGHPTPDAEGMIHALADQDGFAVISDVDDTIVKTYVRDRKKLLETTLLTNAAQVEMVEGVDRAYEAARTAGARAFFYVSGSPHSLHDRITSFMRLHRIPRGPVLLKNFGEDAIFAQDEYKLGRIRTLLSTFPKLRFVMVGDSGERDPEIYQTIAKEQPARVAGIIIRRAPGGDHASARLSGMTVVDHYADDPQLVARLIQTSTRAAAP